MLGSPWLLTPAQHQCLAPVVEAALAQGWPEEALITHLGANADGVRSAAAVLTTRLACLPDPPSAAVTPGVRPPWCGLCDGPEPARRFVSTRGGRVERCSRCNPRWAAASATIKCPTWTIGREPGFCIYPVHVVLGTRHACGLVSPIRPWRFRSVASNSRQSSRSDRERASPMRLLCARPTQIITFGRVSE
jgi:hypothetical protein